MALKPPLTELDISVSDSGFYKNFNKIVAVLSKITIALIVLWAAVFPEEAGKVLGTIKSWSFSNLNYYYTFAVAFFVIVCLVIAIYPKWGKIKLGDPSGVPEFSNFLMVLNDVWCGYRYRYVGLCYR